MLCETQNIDSPRPQKLVHGQTCASHFCDKKAVRLDGHAFPVCRHHAKLDVVVERAYNSSIPWNHKLDLVKKFDRGELQSLAALDDCIDELST